MNKEERHLYLSGIINLLIAKHQITRKVGAIIMEHDRSLLIYPNLEPTDFLKKLVATIGYDIELIKPEASMPDREQPEYRLTLNDVSRGT